MKEIKHKFTKEDVKFFMKHFGVDTPEDGLKRWAYAMYAIGHRSDVHIKKIGKTFITIVEE